MPARSCIEVLSLPSENVPAPPSPNCTFDRGLSFPPCQKEFTAFMRSSTFCPLSSIRGLRPACDSIRAQKRPAGPLPTIRGRRPPCIFSFWQEPCNFFIPGNSNSCSSYFEITKPRCFLARSFFSSGIVNAALYTYKSSGFFLASTDRLRILKACSLSWEYPILFAIKALSASSPQGFFVLNCSIFIMNYSCLSI